MIEDFKFEVFPNPVMIKKATFTLPPRRRTIFFNVSGRQGVAEKFWLSFPRMKFAIVDRGLGGNLYVAFQDNDVICYPHLPNVYSDLRVCLGRMVSLDYETSLEKIVDSILNDFWSSEFNCGTTEAIRKYVTIPDHRLLYGSRTTPSLTPDGERQILAFMRNWEKNTVESPDWFPHENLLPYGGQTHLKE